MTVLITGGSGGLGRAVKNRFISNGQKVISIGLGELDDVKVDLAKVDLLWNVLLWGLLDKGVAANITGIVHCAGRNKITPHDDLLLTDILEMFRINALSNFVINRFAFHAWKAQFICHVISDAAFTPMTHSLAYNVSKAAQLMVMRQMAHEHKPLPVIFGVSPGKIAGTGMSNYIDNTFPALRGMTIEEGRRYQLSKLRTGEMKPMVVADFIFGLCRSVSPHYHGHNFLIGG